MSDPDADAVRYLRDDAVSQAPRIMAECQESHRHGAIPCYEARYGIILTQRPREVHRLLESDRPVYFSPDMSADPADIAAARESLTEAQAALDDPTAA